MEKHVNPQFNKFRPLAITLESLPLIIVLAGFLSSHDILVLIGCTLASLFYMILPWYLFKGLQYTPKDVIAALVLGQGISVFIMGLLFYYMNWDRSGSMIFSSSTIFFFCFILAIVYTIIKSIDREHFKYEIRMSKKILSRYIILIIIFLASGMYKVFAEI